MGGHSIARHYGQGLSFTNLKFQKGGAEIKAAIEARTNLLQEENKKSEEIIQEICKRREIEPSEILSAGDDAEKIEAYSNKMSNSLPSQAKGVFAALEVDLKTLKTQGQLLVRKKVLIDELLRVKNNLQSDRSFDLTFDEICDLGF